MFARVAVEGFGEALLRGMGFNPEEHKTKAIFHEKPRDGLLGLGAKALLPHEKLAAQKRKAAEAQEANRKPGSATDTSAKADEESSAAADNAAAVSEEPQDGKRRRTEVWASRGLLVTVVGNDGQLRGFCSVEAVVLKVDDAAGTCNIKARPASDPDGLSRVLEGVRMSELETRVGRDCKEVRVVRGQHRGAVAKILKRDANPGVVLVKIEGVECEMNLGDVCKFIG